MKKSSMSLTSDSGSSARRVAHTTFQSTTTPYACNSDAFVIDAGSAMNHESIDRCLTGTMTHCIPKTWGVW